MSVSDDDLRSGSVGRFATRIGGEDYRSDGFVRLGSDGRFMVEVLAVLTRSVVDAVDGALSVDAEVGSF